MALKFDMSSPQWARMASYQQQQKMASTLGEDIGTAIGLGAAGIADKAKKRWGKDWKKAVDEGKTKTGDWKEYKQEVRNRERQDKTISKMQKDEQFSGQMDKEWEQYSNFAKNNPNVTKLSKQDWMRKNVDKYSDRFKGYKQSQRKEKFDAFGDKVKGVAGAGLGLAAAPLAITGGVLANLFKKKDKSQPITSDPADLVSDATAEKQAEHTARGTDAVTQGESTYTDPNQAYRDEYDYRGNAPTLAKTQSDYYTKGPVSMRTGQLATEEGIPYQITENNVLYNPNLKTGSGFPGGQPQLGLSTGTEEEMLANRELMAGSSQEVGDREEHRGRAGIQGMIGQALGDESGAAPNILDILYARDDLPSSYAARQQIIDDADTKFQEDWLRLSGQPMVTSDIMDAYYNTPRAKFNRFGEALGETMSFGKPMPTRSNFLSNKPFGVY